MFTGCCSATEKYHKLSYRKQITRQRQWTSTIQLLLLVGVRSIVYVCMSVWPLAYLRKSHVRISPKILYMLPVAVARSFSDGNAICYILPV